MTQTNDKAYCEEFEKWASGKSRYPLNSITGKGYTSKRTQTAYIGFQGALNMRDESKDGDVRWQPESMSEKTAATHSPAETQAAASLANSCEISVVDEEKLRAELFSIISMHKDVLDGLIMDKIMKKLLPYLRTTEPVSVSLEKCGDVLAEEMKRQNLCTDKDIGKTKYKTIVGVDGITCTRRLSKAVLEAAKEQGAKFDYVD